MKFLARYSKAIPVVTAALVQVVGILAGIDSQAYTIVVAVVGAIGVILAPKNQP